MSGTTPIPSLVVGGTGYVAGELLRLLAAHPFFAPVHAVSESQPGSGIAAAFPHLAPAYGAQSFVGIEEALDLAARLPRSAIFAAAPHGASAALIGRLLEATRGREARIVDLSADHRFRTPEAYAAVYGERAAPAGQLDEFCCAVPEHLEAASARHVAHPGCFASAMLLALVPLLRHGLIGGEVYLSGVTGSTGSGRKPTGGTHHPDRHADLYAYRPLAHRHAAEVEALCEQASGTKPRVHFVPHSGPFARGIHVTLQAKLNRQCSATEINTLLATSYATSPFVRILDTEPHVKHVAGSNYAALHAATDADSVVVLSVLDNLTKGAAGGAIQWMNRLQGLPQTSGLLACAPGWT